MLLQTFNYGLGQRVLVLPSTVMDTAMLTGMSGRVVNQVENSTYQYEVQLSDGETTKFKEEELKGLPDGINGIRLIPEELCYYNGNKVAIMMIDWVNEQAEIQFQDDGAMSVVNYNHLYGEKFRDKFESKDSMSIFQEIADELANKLPPVVLMSTNNKQSVSGAVVKTDAEIHKEILENMHEVYKAKNADYGNSFGVQFDKFGLLSLVIRLNDKLARLEQLVSNDTQVKDEKIEDTILDACNYCAMALVELQKQKQAK